MLPPAALVLLLLLYSSDTLAGETREGVPELLSSNAREDDKKDADKLVEERRGTADRKRGMMECLYDSTGCAT